MEPIGQRARLDRMMNLQSRSRWPAAAFLVIEALAGMLFGLALGVLTGLAGARMFASSASGWGDLIGGLLGAIAGHTLGVSIGVYLAGRTGCAWPVVLPAARWCCWRPSHCA